MEMLVWFPPIGGELLQGLEALGAEMRYPPYGGAQSAIFTSDAQASEVKALLADEEDFLLVTDEEGYYFSPDGGRTPVRNIGYEREEVVSGG